MGTRNRLIGMYTGRDTSSYDNINLVMFQSGCHRYDIPITSFHFIVKHNSKRSRLEFDESATQK